ncbi:MAG: histidinol-phosphate transaminase [Candidatus Hydrogenedentes bacterium]|nr:histidinol-phosphate transaminase [Candidatus Hydrogenedentota bacterium]
MKYGREILKDVQGYVPGEQPGVANVIKLNTNENPYPPSPNVLDAIRNYTTEAARKYPDPVSSRLRRACADRYGYSGPEWVIAGNGMDELLALALRTFVDPGDTVLSPYPTYTLYETLALLHGAKIKLVDLDKDFQLTNEFFTTPARLCFLPRPNAPSGVCAPRADVERFCKHFQGIVVIDEAYVDFADDNCMDFPKQFDNVIVMRTFSKAYSLAGLRLGVAVAQPEIINELMKGKDSYNVNGVTQAAGTEAICDAPYFESTLGRVKATRARLIDSLCKMGFDVTPSQSNFVLAQWAGTPSAREIFEKLKEDNIFVRYFNARRLENALRITVGTESETSALLGALEEILASANGRSRHGVETE